MNLNSLRNIFSLDPKTYLFLFLLVVGVVSAVNRIDALRTLVMGG